MLEYIYQWIQNIAFYLIIIVAVMQMIPGESYKKYIRFFAGMILIFMLASPILKIFGMTDFHNEEYREKLKEIEEATDYMKDIIEEENIDGE